MTRADENGRRHKTGGRQAGTPNRSTALIREAMLSVFADLQAGSGAGHGHFLEWARSNATEFYKLTAKLLPLQITGGDGGPLVTRIELVAPGIGELLPPCPADDLSPPAAALPAPGPAAGDALPGPAADPAGCPQ